MRYELEFNSAASQNGATPLHWAVVSGTSEVAALILERGAELEAKDMVCITSRTHPRSQRSSGWAFAPHARSMVRRRCTQLQNGASLRPHRCCWNAVQT
jgi:hypothetical protein